MGAAVDQHNVVLRSLLDEHGGHEVRTDGDSFTLAFHDAADAVAYCIQVRAASAPCSCIMPHEDRVHAQYAEVTAPSGRCRAVAKVVGNIWVQTNSPRPVGVLGLQAQEELLEVPWPKKLLEHPYCATVRLGEVCATKHPEAAAQVVHKGGIPLDKQGPLVMNGLRVRMGINTGVPDDIFVHDLTEHVEYRGEWEET